MGNDGKGRNGQEGGVDGGGGLLLPGGAATTSGGRPAKLSTGGNQPPTLCHLPDKWRSSIPPLL